MRIRKYVVLIIVFLLSGNFLFGEMDFSNVFNDYHRTMYLIGLEEADTLNFHTNYYISTTKEKISGPWKGNVSYDPVYDIGKSKLTILTPELWSSYNVTKPWGGNDGEVWQGKGINAQLTGGFKFDSSYISLQIKPKVWFAQNLNFSMIDTTYSSGYGDYWTEFDNLQRYGDKSYYDFSLGESYARAAWKGVSLGVSTESIRLGPGQKNNIILSDNAGGFPHIDLGTDGKVTLSEIGDIEFKLLWGILEESEFFDDNTDNDHGWISGTYLSFSPNFIPHFMVGFNHQYYKPLSDWDGYDLIRGIPFLDRSNSAVDTKDMMMSIPFYWRFPEVGFEVYGEWARNDNFGSIKDLIHSPEHTHGFSIGVNQVIQKWSQSYLLFSLEMSSMGQERTHKVRPAGPWYRHGWAGWTQGYTHNGQLLGAAIGPGSDSQWLQVALYQPNGLWAFSFQRVAHDKDYFYKIFNEQQDVSRFSELNFGIKKLVFFNNMELFIKGDFVYLLNNNYLQGNTISNMHMEIGMKYFY